MARPSSLVPLLPPLLTLFCSGCLRPPLLADATLSTESETLDTWGDPIELESAAGSTSTGPGSESGSMDTSGTSATSGVDPGLGDLKITEVHADPDGKDGDLESPEFIEIENRGPREVPLANLVIRADNWSVLDAERLALTDQVLPPGGVLVVRRWNKSLDPEPERFLREGSLILSGFFHGDGLKNTQGSVTIGVADADIDTILYGPADDTHEGWMGAPSARPEAGDSLCRIRLEDHDDALDWSACISSPGEVEELPAGDEGGNGDGADSGTSDAETGVPSPSPIAYGALQIIEVHADPPGPASDEKYWEFIELINTSEIEIELEPCRIGDSGDPNAPGVDTLEYNSGDGGCDSLTCLAPGRRALIVGQSYIGETGDALVLNTDDTLLADGGLTMTEPVVLWDAGASLVSSYRLWPDPGMDPKPIGEQPLHRINPEADDSPSSWVVAPASPGL